jgi:hypothetical protein
MLIYLIAAAVGVFPFTEFVVRLPNAVIGGILNPLLMYAVARELTFGRMYALSASVLLALTPAHLILSRQAMDYVLTIPFVLGWLWSTASYLRTGQTWRAWLSGGLLGVGCYSYIAAWIIMPLYLALTWALYWRQGRDKRASLAAAAGFALALAPAIPWLWNHPEMLRETFARYRLSEPQQLSVFADPAQTPVVTQLKTTSTAYASFFDPVFLFVRGGASLVTSTGRAGVFLAPMAVLIAVGAYIAWRQRNQPGLHGLVLAGFLSAPLPAALMGEPYMVQRELFVVVWAVLLAVYGLATLMSDRRLTMRWTAVLLLAMMPVQFAVFYRDFFTHYKLRSGFYYDPVAAADTTQSIIALDEEWRAPAIYLDAELDDAGARWRFYATRFQREELLTRTQYFTGDGRDLLVDTPPGTLAVMPDTRVIVEMLEKTGLWTVARMIYDVDRRAATVILRKIDRVSAVEPSPAGSHTDPGRQRVLGRLPVSRLQRQPDLDHHVPERVSRHPEMTAALADELLQRAEI